VGEPHSSADGDALLRTTLLTAAIRRDILTLLADSDGTSVQAATAQVAAGWGARHRRRGDSPSSVHTAQAIALQVGADLADDEASAGWFGGADHGPAGRAARARTSRRSA
jgi:hypothetical protein